MRKLVGKTAFVTGGASGIGLALGRAFAEAGVKVMLADIETDALAAAVTSLHNVGPDVRGIDCDVTDPASVERAAKASFDAFGNVHIVCNNAGVAAGGGIKDIALDSWRWGLAAIRANELYVFTHADMRTEVENRFTAIAAAFDKTAARRPG